MFEKCYKINRICDFAFYVEGDQELRCGQLKGSCSPHSLVSDVRECDGKHPKCKHKEKKEEDDNTKWGSQSDTIDYTDLDLFNKE